MASSVDRARIADWFRRFRRWRAPLRRFLIARGTLGAHDVDDIAQEVFFRLLRYQNSELIEHPEAYLFRMATNVADEWAMLARHRRPHGSQWLSDLPAPSRPDHEAAQEAANREFLTALQALPVRQREILRLHYGEGLTRAEIASQLQITERMVKRDLIMAYAALRTERNAEWAAVLREESL
jgi:RNA polymerase sigma factor (sigma-70 family)